MLLFNRPLGSRLTLPAIDDPPIHVCYSLSISQELCLRSSLESQSSTSTSADPVLGFQPIKTQKLIQNFRKAYLKWVDDADENL